MNHHVDPSQNLSQNLPQNLSQNLSQQSCLPGVGAIASTPVDQLIWSPIEHFNQMRLLHLEMGMRGVYVIRYRDNPNQLRPASVLYVAADDYCIRRQLLADYMGQGNQFLPDFVHANPLGVYFQYALCDNPKDVKVCLIRSLGYPVCN